MIEDRRTAHGTAPARRQDSYLERNGARLRYRDEGKGAAVVFVHGWTLDLDMWEPQAAALTAAYRVIRWDRRGFGLSSGKPSLIDDVADLHALCLHLGLQRVALVGMSQGARVVLQAASGSPAAVSCLVLDGPPSIGAAAAAPEPQDLPYEDYRRLAQTQGMAAFRRAWLQHPLARLTTENARARELLALMLARYPGIDLTAPAPRPAAAAVQPAIQTIVQPVLVIGGALDIASRRQSADELARGLPRAERAEIPGAGHMCNLDNPGAYGSALRNFLDHHTNAQSFH